MVLSGYEDSPRDSSTIRTNCYTILRSYGFYNSILYTFSWSSIHELYSSSLWLDDRAIIIIQLSFFRVSFHVNILRAK